MPGTEGWDTLSGAAAWRAAAHGFAWMRDLRALGTDAARLHARALTADWLARGADEPVADVPEVMGSRLSAWLGHWDFFAATAEDGFRRAVMTRMPEAPTFRARRPGRARGASPAEGGEAAAWLEKCTSSAPPPAGRDRRQSTMRIRSFARMQLLPADPS